MPAAVEKRSAWMQLPSASSLLPIATIGSSMSASRLFHQTEPWCSSAPVTMHPVLGKTRGHLSAMDLSSSCSQAESRLTGD